MKVFIVDDSSGVVERLAGIVRRVRGVEFVGWAATVPEATQSIDKLQPDVVILDLHLKGGSGFDVLTSIKRTSPGIQVIVLTDYPSPQYRRRCLELGAESLLDKSAEFAKLPEIFRRMINGKKAA